MNKRYTLAIDFGNTLVKAGVFDEQKLIKLYSSTNLDKKELTAIIQRHSIVTCSISAVTSKSAGIEKFVSRLMPTTILNPGTPVPLKNRYATKYSLGNDRLASAVAGASLFPHKNVLVVTCGTCITCDLVNSNNEYRGGSISPGLDMRFKSLNAFTAKLPLIKKKNYHSFTGNSTEKSILSGVITGAALEIDGFINLYGKSFPGLKVILSGGDANFLASHLKNKIFAVPNMVLTGLNQILHFNNAEI